MLRNYFKTALRSLKKQGVFTFMNVIGLSTGIACFILITLFVRDEVTYDRHHTNVDRIYRGMTLYKVGFVAGLGDYLVANIGERMPEVEAITRIDYGTRAILEFDGKMTFEQEFYHADPGLFEVFDFPLLYGNEEDALITQNSLVISKYIMNKYFEGKNPIGKTLALKNQKKPFVITGVFEEIPDNSRFKFNLVAPIAKSDFSDENAKWIPSGLLYARVTEGTSVEAFQDRVNELAIELGQPGKEQLDHLIESFGDLYLKSNYSFTASGISGDADFIWVFAVIAVVLLLIACINYINAATARALNRNKEIGVRRVVGASAKQIRRQFLTETACTTLLAVILSAGLVEVLLPGINELAGKNLKMQYFNDPFAIPFLVALVPLVTLLAGFYPAFFSSRIKALNLFSNNNTKGKGWLRHSLVIFQFTITLTLIFCTQVILSQVDAFQDNEIGLETNGVISPITPRGYDFDLFKNTLSTIAGVESVTSAPFPYPSGSILDIAFSHEGRQDTLRIDYYKVEPNVPEVFKMNMISGTGFDQTNSGLADKQVLISEKAAELLPFENPLGEQIMVRNDEYRFVAKTIVGVYQSPNFDAKSEGFTTIMSTTDQRYKLYLKLASENQKETIVRLSKAWEEIVPNQPFEYSYLNDQVLVNYEKERKFGVIFKYFAGVAIVIAVLGLLGLSAFTLVKKYKEIGIRKVLGASVLKITSGLIQRYLMLVLLATLVAAPLAYFLMDSWLTDFANRISISAGIFLIGLGLSIALLMLTVGYQTLRAAMLNPVDVLKDE